MNIVLIGYRGTGKSVVGSMSIPDIVNTAGWKKFRDMESEVAKKLSKQDNIIIDTGGGVIERSENIDALRLNSYIIWLKASVETIVLRIQGGTDRPSLTDGVSFTEEVAQVLEQRIPKYKNAAQYEIDTDRLTPTQIADELLNYYNTKV